MTLLLVSLNASLYITNIFSPFSFSPFSPILAYVLQVKVEMELEIQQCEKTKAVREEQLERLTQICQEQAVSTNTSEIYFALLTFNWCGKVF